jgi:hypothetical protein
MNNQTLCTAAVSARESARQGNGKFGFQAATEADIDLDFGGPNDGDGFDAFASAEQPEPARGELVFRQKDGKVFSPEEIQKIAQRSGQYWFDRYQVSSKTGTQLASPEDLANESIASVAKMLRNAEDGGKPVTSIVQAISSCAANHAVRATAVVWKPVDRAAYIAYAEELEKLKRAVNRPYTEKEKDGLAMSIRDNWHNARHKPSKDFRMAITVDRSLNRSMTGEPDGPTLGETLVDDGEIVHTIMPGTATDEVLIFKEQNDRGATALSATRARVSVVAFHPGPSRGGRVDNEVLVPALRQQLARP